MPAIDIKRWMESLRAQLQQSRQRQLVLLRGSRDWCDREFEAIVASETECLLFSDRDSIPNAIAFSNADTRLGGETDLVAVDLFSGFNADLLCIAAGLVRAGGVLLLIAPPTADWPAIDDVYGSWQQDRRAARASFVEYFFDSLAADANIGLRLSADGDLPALPELPALEPGLIENGLTAEQAELLPQIESRLMQNRAGVVLVSAERGRGKSTLLGLLAARLQKSMRVLVSANSRASAGLLLRVAADAEFVAPDRLLQQAPPADLLIVDEAAMIPQAMLQQFETLYPRLLLATTSGGYEGTGQGFMLRFVDALGAERVTHYRLDAPVRWCQGDLLESWLDHTLMLQNQAPADLPPTSAADCEIAIVAEPGARENRAELRALFQLLNSAHYRTRPSDLRMLMENPDQVLLVARYRQQPVGVALLNLEGGFDANLCEQVFLGRRRPRGHLLAQMLTAQAGVADFARLRGIRVQRIAVRRAWRRRGVGSALLEFAAALGRERNCDYLGASFALDPQTAPFWQQAGCELVHVSFAQGKSSGNHSVAVLRKLDSRVDAALELLRQRLQRQLPTWMTQFLRYLSAGQVSSLLRMARFDAGLNRHELDEVRAFAHGNRGFELGFASLQKFVMQRIAVGEGAADGLLVAKAVQNHDWNLLSRETGSSGRKAMLRQLRASVEALLKGC